MIPAPTHGRCTGLWGTRGPDVDGAHGAVDSRGRAIPALPSAVETVHPLWSAAPAATSAYTRWSTIHTPYYRNCQN